MAASQDDKTIIMFHRPNSREKLFFFSSGIITSVPLTIFVGTFTNSLCVVLPIFYARFCSTAIFTPFVEEFAKAYPLLYRHGETEKSIFTLGLLVGLGFGLAEFLLYVIAFRVPIYFRLPGIFFHAASTSITAYGIATKRPAQFYLIAVFLHFLNNFSAVVDPLWFIFGIALAITYYLSWHLYGKVSERIAE